MKKILALVFFLLLSCNANAACRVQFLGGNTLDMRAREGRMERVVQVRLSCEEETQGVLSVEPMAGQSRWGRDVVSVSVGGHDLRKSLEVTATNDGTLIELYVSSRVHRYSQTGDETLPFAIRFMY